MFLGCSVNVHFHLFVPLSDSEDLNSWKTKNKTHNKLKWTTNDTAYYSILSSLEVWWSTNYPQDLPTCDSSSNKYYSVKKSTKIFGWSLSTTKIKSFQNGLSCQTHSLVIPDIDFFHTNQSTFDQQHFLIEIKQRKYIHLPVLFWHWTAVVFYHRDLCLTGQSASVELPSPLSIFSV